jgi:hypothetical protein
MSRHTPVLQRAGIALLSSEDRLATAAGAWRTDHFFLLGDLDSRALEITATGRRELKSRLGLTIAR